VPDGRSSKKALTEGIFSRRKDRAMTVADCTNLDHFDMDGDVYHTLYLVERLETTLRGLRLKSLLTREELAEGVGDVASIRSRLVGVLNGSPDDPGVLSIAA
jgi:hypothetical protein